MAQQLVIRKASRQKAFLKLGIASPSGGGKTLGSLLIGYGLMKEKYPNLSDSELWEKIVIVDSENGSGELYVGMFVEDSNITIGEYAVLPLEAPFEPKKYTQAIQLAHESAFEVVIVDSMTHMWAGTGGALEKQGKIADRIRNKYAAWREVTPEITKLIDTILQTPIHVISTMRSKTDHIQEKDASGKTVVRKVGLNPVIRDGMEYEFTIFFEIDAKHEAFCSKDRTNQFDGRYFTITPDIGKRAMAWLNSGADKAGEVIAESKISVEELSKKAVSLAVECGGSGNESVMAILKKYQKDGRIDWLKDEEELKKAIKELEEFKENK